MAFEEAIVFIISEVFAKSANVIPCANKVPKDTKGTEKRHNREIKTSFVEMFLQRKIYKKRNKKYAANSYLQATAPPAKKQAR